MGGDPGHHEHTSKMVKESISKLSFVQKLLLFFTMFLNVLFVMLPGKVLTKLGIQSNKKFKLKRLFTTPEVYSGEYFVPGGWTSNCVVIKGKDGSVLIRSPPPLTKATLQAVSEVGEVKLILSTLSHDSNVDAWKKEFPQSVVVGAKCDVEILNDKVKMDSSIEDLAKSVLQNYFIERVLSTIGWTESEEPILVLDLGNERKAVSMGCMISNNEYPSPLHPFFLPFLLIGNVGFRVTRLAALLFTKDVEAGKRVWNEVKNIPGLEGVVLLHGKSLIGRNQVQAYADKLQF